MLHEILFLSNKFAQGKSHKKKMVDTETNNSSVCRPWQIRKRSVNVHVSDSSGSRVVGAKIAIHQMSRDFPLGSAISKTILGNKPYQVRRPSVRLLKNEFFTITLSMRR
jgi:hypothetical protein